MSSSPINEPDKRDQLISIRVSKEEKALIKNTAKTHGFRSLGAFIMWVVSNLKKD